ncbi:hypothetical protein J2S53_002581 [Actinopolyspora lacussalsi]|uniref:Uncharacterized protein n=1 Tax=Actinopolyspora righensis TaxID=995060 RepID=A0A1I6Z744_9ACTN|nr:hypothetical protein [Actinopolyspora righensis]MDP9642636.1 hypothetical protein [Actinopolyspora lacussalsi]SFT58540.1 hypothetical protein SAMN04487904_10440 [Actinopolyspora righensis]
MSRSRTIDTPDDLRDRVPEFLVPPETLDTVSPSGDRGGMIIGSGPHGEPISTSILRPQPTRMVTVGGLYLARQIALRAMATGAWVIIATGRPDSWENLATAAGHTPDGTPVPLVQIRRLTPFDLPRSSEDAPLLVIHDGGAVPQELFPPRSAWQTTMYVLPYLHPQVGNGTAANTADLVLLQRIPMNQAQLAGRIWHLHPPQVQQLTALQDDGIIALGNMLWSPIRLVTNHAERELLGPIRRGD